MSLDSQAILEAAEVGIYAIDTAGICTYVNPAAATRLGCRPEDCVGRNMTELIAHAPSPVESTSQPIVANGKIQGTVVTLHDGIHRKPAEEALREKDEQLRTLANSLPQLAWMADPKGSRYWYNQRWYDYTGASPE